MSIEDNQEFYPDIDDVNAYMGGGKEIFEGDDPKY